MQSTKTNTNSLESVERDNINDISNFLTEDLNSDIQPDHDTIAAKYTISKKKLVLKEDIIKQKEQCLIQKDIIIQEKDAYLNRKEEMIC